MLLQGWVAFTAFLDSLLFCHSSRLLCELLQEAVPVALQGVGWETWKELEKSEREEEGQRAGDLPLGRGGDHPPWGQWSARGKAFLT